MITVPTCDIRDLAIIGDRRSAALITTTGAVVWYCPGRFDYPALLAALLDPQHGGAWALQLPEAQFVSRRYLGDSGILETTLSAAGGELRLTDWMLMADTLPRGICRRFSAAPTDLTLTLQAAPDYGRSAAKLQYDNLAVQIDRHYLYASHPLKIVAGQVDLRIPAGEAGWTLLLDEPLSDAIAADLFVQPTLLDRWFETTLESWQTLAGHLSYSGLYERQVKASIRALRLLTFEPTGGVIAAPTLGLPEVVGGDRNYDYRYVWLRDAGMIVSAMTRAGSDGTEERRFLEFIYHAERDGELPLYPFSTVVGKPVQPEEKLALVGYRQSQPVAMGNRARQQLQLDAYGNVLLAAKLIYTHFKTREQWPLIAELADFLADHWQEPDNGLWEEQGQRQYTSSKVVAACGLEYISEFAETEAQARRWQIAAQAIRAFVEQHCLTSEGAYAAVAGGEAVDVSAALFPVWGYIPADTPEMLATLRVLERDYGAGNLYRRHLEEFDSQQEGIFLAGTFWVAQYWVMRADFERVNAILKAALEYANDLGLFAEEADPKTGKMLGNFPQSFVHAAFVGVVIDLEEALKSASAQS